MLETKIPGTINERKTTMIDSDLCPTDNSTLESNDRDVQNAPIDLIFYLTIQLCQAIFFRRSGTAYDIFIEGRKTCGRDKNGLLKKILLS